MRLERMGNRMARPEHAAVGNDAGRPAVPLTLPVNARTVVWSLERCLVTERPHADAVTREIATVLGPNDSVYVENYGHGWGAVHVTVADWTSTAADWFRTRREWAYAGPAMEAATDGASVAPCNWIEFRRDVRVDEDEAEA